MLFSASLTIASSTLLLDLASSVVDSVLSSDAFISLQLVPSVIQALSHCALLSPDCQRDTFSMIDYVFSKVDAVFSHIFTTTDFYLKDWTLQEFYCTVYAQIQFYYFKSDSFVGDFPVDLHSFLLSLFQSYLQSQNRKENRLGMMMLKTVMELDFKEHQQVARHHSFMHAIPIEQYQWKRGEEVDG